MPRAQSSCVLRRVFIGVVAVVLWLCVPSRASASLIQFNFTGTWTFYDPVDHAPDFWRAMGSYGIELSPTGTFSPTPVSFSLVVDDATPDSDADPSFGLYSNSIVQMSFSAANLEFTAGRAQMSAPHLGIAAGTTHPYDLNTHLSSLPSFGGYTPSVIDSSLFIFGQTVLPSTALIPSLSNWNAFGPTAGLVLTFTGNNQVLLGLQLASVKAVPAPSSSVTICSSILGLMAWAVWRRAIQP
jgi:hypothetical protein